MLAARVCGTAGGSAHAKSRRPRFLGLYALGHILSAQLFATDRTPRVRCRCVGSGRGSSGRAIQLRATPVAYSPQSTFGLPSCLFTSASYAHATADRCCTSQAETFVQIAVKLHNPPRIPLHFRTCACSHMPTRQHLAPFRQRNCVSHPCADVLARPAIGAFCNQVEHQPTHLLGDELHMAGEVPGRIAIGPAPGHVREIGRASCRERVLRRV